MGASSLLDQLLKSGADALVGARRAAGPNLPQYAKGAAVGGLLGLLLGSGSGRRTAAKALKWGSVAAIGALAWKAYQDHQAQQEQTAPQAQPDRPAPAASAAARGAAATAFDALPAPQLERHAQAMLQAMIAAARSDGHLDDRERELVMAEVERLGADDATRRWVDAELSGPLDAARVAAAAGSPEQAAELYLASLLVVDEQSPAERAYLDELARHLRLDPALKVDLEARAAAA